MSKRTATALIVLVLVSMVLLAMPRPAPARFALSSWDFPDAYGQGIEGFMIYENSTGSWVAVDGYHLYDEANIFAWNVSVAMKLHCFTWFNSTLVGATDTDDGKNYQRHSVNVTDNLGGSVFSQQNFTYYSADDGIDPPLWFYEYYVVLNFLPVEGEYYTVTVTYEIYW